LIIETITAQVASTMPEGLGKIRSRLTAVRGRFGWTCRNNPILEGKLSASHIIPGVMANGRDSELLDWSILTDSYVPPDSKLTTAT
jgi:hypothetical protein